MMDIKSVENFYKKYNNKRLADTGSTVSREYNNFQNAFMRMMKNVADTIGAEITKKSKGHYDGSLFLKRGGKYVYVSFGNSVNRTNIDLDNSNWNGFIYCRTAKNDKDYTGGTNNFVSLKELPKRIDFLLG